MWPGCIRSEMGTGRLIIDRDCDGIYGTEGRVERMKKTKQFRVWAGLQKKGSVIEGRWKGAEPLLNIGVHIYSNDVEQGLKASEVAKAVVNSLKGNFPSYELVISPSASEVLGGRHDGLASFPRG